MRHRHFAILCLLGIVFTGVMIRLSLFLLDTRQSKRGGGLTPSPREVIHDFGLVAAGRILTHDFALANGFDDVVEIKRIEPSCSCAVAAVRKRLLGPHESTEVCVTLDTRGLRGPLQKGCRVLYSCLGRDYITSITLKGTVVSDPRLVPGHLDFGYIEVGTTVQKTLEVQGFRKDFKVLRTEGSGGLDIQFWCVSENPLPRYKVRVLLTADSASGDGRTEHRVRLTTNDETRPVIDVPVYSRCLPAIRLEPSSLFLQSDSSSRVPIGRAMIVLSSGTIKDVRIEEVQGPLSAVISQEPDGSTYWLHVQPKEPALEPAFQGTVAVHISTDRTTHVATLRVYGLTALMKND